MVLAASAFGLLDSLEYWLYDQRAIHCQLAEQAPTSRFVHLDIDDASVSPTALGAGPGHEESWRKFWMRSSARVPPRSGWTSCFPSRRKSAGSSRGWKVTRDR